MTHTHPAYDLNLTMALANKPEFMTRFTKKVY